MLNGLKGADPRCDLVMIHDGARPLISQQLILKCIAETLRTKATVVAVPAKNTIKVVRRENDMAVVDHTPDRENLYEVQTPQSFDYALIMAAYAKAAADGVAATDDASLVEHYGEPVTIVRGYYNNIKICPLLGAGIERFIGSEGKKQKKFRFWAKRRKKIGTFALTAAEKTAPGAVGKRSSAPLGGFGLSLR